MGIFNEGELSFSVTASKVKPISVSGFTSVYPFVVDVNGFREEVDSGLKCL